MADAVTFALPAALDGAEPARQFLNTNAFHREVLEGEGFDVQRLINLGLPAGLAQLVSDEDRRIALRVFLLDNSGSTIHPDGKRLVWDEDRPRFMRCTRWDEVVNMALEHARWNADMGTPAEFVLLNPPEGGFALEDGFGCVRVDQTKGDVKAQIAQLEALLEGTQPNGATPLTQSLFKIRNRILPEARDIARRGRKVVLVIVTDGLPSDDEGCCDEREMTLFGQELRRMSTELPIHQVVRLCTNDPKVIDFYSSLDEELEVELEVIDDIQGEAAEIRGAGNRWLVYSPVIHRLREGGTFLKVFDLLDERCLEPLEVLLVCQLLLRQNPDDPALPSEPRALCDAVRKLVPSLPLVLNPLSMKMEPPIKVDEVELAILPKAMAKQPLKNMWTEIALCWLR